MASKSASRVRRAAAIAIWALVVVGLAWAAIRVLGLERGYPLVPLIAYTPYVAVLAVPVALAAGALRMWPCAGAAAAVAVTLAIVVLPRAFGSGPEPEPAGGQRLDVLAANLMFGNADPEALVKLVHDEQIDVIAIQELTPGAVSGLRDAGLEDALPEHALFPAPRAAGSGLYARYPLRDIDPGESAVYGFGMPRAKLHLPGGGEIAIISVHSVAPTGSAQVGLWEAGLDSLPAATPEREPRVLAGDFNATLDHSQFRDVLDSGYVDAADAAGEGLRPTWPSDLLPPPVTIDHVLADETLGVGKVSIHDLPGSDHRAVSAELSVPAAP